MTPPEMLSVPVDLNKMQMLFWRLDLSKRSFVTLNDCSVGVIGRENYRFFKDREYREKMLFCDDLIRFEKAAAGFKDRVPVRVVFRVSCDNRISWFKLTGWPTSDLRYYEGAVEDISDHVASLQNIFDHQGQRLLDVDSDSYPVALFSESRGNLLLRSNSSFRKLIGPGQRRKKYRIDDLLAKENLLDQLLEQLLTERRVSSTLVLRAGKGQTVTANCRLEYFFHDNKGFIRCAIVDQIDSEQASSDNGRKSGCSEEIQQLCADLADCMSIEKMLMRIYQEKQLFPNMDVVMFSDIYARKNKVLVYSVGELNEPLDPGTQFPYTGTIAENIEKENLDYLIVDDTHSSIKAIDWVLFVPKGLYSYVAKALYVRGAMRTVLILCSRKKKCFQ